MSDHMRGDVMQASGRARLACEHTTLRYVSGRLQRGGDAFPDAWHGFGWAWDDFDSAYSAGIDELFFNEGMFQVTLRAGQREGARCDVTVKPDIGYPSLRSFVTTCAARTPRGPDGDDGVAANAIADRIPWTARAASLRSAGRLPSAIRRPLDVAVSRSGTRVSVCAAPHACRPGAHGRGRARPAAGSRYHREARHALRDEVAATP